jgi:hypothetical protein
MWPYRLSANSVRRSMAVACVLSLMPVIAPAPADALSSPRPQHGSATNTVRIQAGSAKLAGVWVSKTGEQFEVTQADDTVEMAFSGPTPSSKTGKISGSFDGVVFAGAYEAAEGSTTDRGVVRFLRKTDGTLEGSWRSLVTGRQGTWSLTKK